MPFLCLCSEGPLFGTGFSKNRGVGTGTVPRPSRILSNPGHCHVRKIFGYLDKRDLMRQNSSLQTTSQNVPVWCLNWFLTYVEFGNVEHFPPADHIFPLNEKFKRVCSLPGRD